jgi:hypothetical protein
MVLAPARSCADRAGGRADVANAVRLGTRADTPQRQSALARSVLREHLFCFASIAALIALQLSCS